MSTGFTLDGFPSMGCVDELCPRQRVRRPARLCRDSRSARRAADRPATMGQRLPARRVPGHRVQCREAHPQSRAPASIGDATETATRDFLRRLNERAPRAEPRRQRTRRAHRQLRTRRKDAARAPRSWVIMRGESKAHARALRRGRCQREQGRLRQELHPCPAAARARCALRAALQRQLRHGRRRGQLGRAQDHRRHSTRSRADPRPAVRRACCAI